ncbi:MAG: aminotransferase class V-fold PLP-dependent enzyme, partial [Candidatus Nanopelagicales bacterium]|nr:aminotransferase class V-fold PLP-dependent enzyme [Candidatus Nanopelagicales bacterium]
MTNPALRDIASFRDRFAIFEHLTYINSCSQGALSTEVAAAYEDYLGGLRRHGSPWEEWVGVQEDVRVLLASILGAQVSEVAVTSSASAAVNAIASSFDFANGPSTIVTTDMEFPTIGQIWHAQERRGAHVVHVPAGDSGVVSPESIAAAISADTALVSITHACYRNGAMNDVAAIVETAHAHGVPVLVDAYQTVGAIPINFAELGADFLVGGALKYMLSSAGVGFALVNSATT